MKTFLFHHDEPWMKKNGQENFNILVGCHDGAETFKLVSTFILSKISPIIPKKMFEYREMIYSEICQGPILRKKIPLSVSLRISNSSSNQSIFKGTSADI